MPPAFSPCLVLASAVPTGSTLIGFGGLSGLQLVLKIHAKLRAIEVVAPEANRVCYLVLGTKIESRLPRKDIAFDGLQQHRRRYCTRL